MLILIFLASVAAILAIYYMLKVPFIPFVDEPGDTVLFNIILALVLAAMFDRGLWIVAVVVLCGKLLVDKIRQYKENKKKEAATKETKKEDGTV